MPKNSLLMMINKFLRENPRRIFEIVHVGIPGEITARSSDGIPGAISGKISAESPEDTPEGITRGFFCKIYREFPQVFIRKHSVIKFLAKCYRVFQRKIACKLLK